jgi:DNA repair photolyase
MNKFVRSYGEKGLRLLVVFKNVKGRTAEHLEDEYPNINWNEFEDKINQECIKLSKEIIDKNKDNPTEDEIRQLIESIKYKLENTMN